MKRRVVVTGLGLITPCGNGWKPYWDAVVSGSSHIRAMKTLHLNGFPSKLAGEILEFNPADYVKQKKHLKVMSREIQLAVAASHFALQDACLNMAAIDRFRFGVSLGAGIINNDLDEVGIGIRNSLDEQGRFQMNKFGQEGIRSMFPLWFLKYLPNMPACHISITHGLQGPNNTITTSAAAAAQAIGEAMRVIRRGDADLMLAGGTDSKVNAMGISRFHLLGLLSSRNGVPPEQIYCPFDRRSDGMLLGEGAGLLVLEEREHAVKRGAKIYGEIIGYGSSSDFNYDPRMTPDWIGKGLAMERALHDASLDTDGVDFILANGSGIRQDDIQESVAISNVFQNDLSKVKVTAVKPVTGHVVYGSGSIEMAAGLCSLQEKVIPPIINLQESGPECDLPFVTQTVQTCDSQSFLLNSFGFGGQNASLVVRR